MNAKEPQIHQSIDNKNKLSDDLLVIDQIAERNLSTFINGKEINEAIKLVPAYVTRDEKMEAEKIETKTIAELQLLIFQKIKVLSNEKQELHEEIYQKTVRNKNKEKYICLLYTSPSPRDS